MPAPRKVFNDLTNARNAVSEVNKQLDHLSGSLSAAAAITNCTRVHAEEHQELAKLFEIVCQERDALQAAQDQTRTACEDIGQQLERERKLTKELRSRVDWIRPLLHAIAESEADHHSTGHRLAAIPGGLKILKCYQQLYLEKNPEPVPEAKPSYVVQLERERAELREELAGSKKELATAKKALTEQERRTAELAHSFERVEKELADAKWSLEVLGDKCISLEMERDAAKEEISKLTKAYDSTLTRLNSETILRNAAERIREGVAGDLALFRQQRDALEKELSALIIQRDEARAEQQTFQKRLREEEERVAHRDRVVQNLEKDLDNERAKFKGAERDRRSNYDAWEKENASRKQGDKERGDLRIRVKELESKIVDYRKAIDDVYQRVIHQK